MRAEVIVSFPENEEFRLDPNAIATWQPHEGRQWLDQQFVALDCEPLRASGKVLLADKALVVAATAGPEYFENEEWSAKFAQAVTAALDKPVVKIDVAAQEVSF